jgi:SAM-dependent methyltransferase
MSSRAGEALRLRALDALDLVRGRRDRLVPPRRLQGVVGDSDFVATGEEVAGLLVEAAGLRPGDRVLDVGCGFGRVARALIEPLGPEGSYEGFDASEQAVAWCARRYARRHPAFRFTHVDVRNATYNPGGALAAREVEFPYDDASFDVALAASVFTHLLADGTDRYLAEAARVLRTGGRLLATLFLLDDEARRLQREGGAAIAFRQEHWPTVVADPAEPEAAVGYDEAWVRGRLADHGLELLDPVRRGRWSGRRDAAGFQDVIVAAA